MDRKIAIVIPTRNAGKEFHKLLEQLDEQTLQPAVKLVVDTESSDGTPEAAAKHGFDVIGIEKKDFGHGKTRQMAFEQVKNDVEAVIYMTQDVVLKDEHTFENIVASLFSADNIGAVYGRQLPKYGASVMSKIQRGFSYPDKSFMKTFKDKATMGIKAPFLSDAFTIYRTDALEKVGGFPDVNISEDMYVGAKMLMAGFSLAYAADAAVYHSHEFTLGQLWDRYYATGKFQQEQSWIGETFGKGEGAGIQLLKQQMKALWKHDGLGACIKCIIDDVMKYGAYLAGTMSVRKW